MVQASQPAERGDGHCGESCPRESDGGDHAESRLSWQGILWVRGGICRPEVSPDRPGPTASPKGCVHAGSR